MDETGTDRRRSLTIWHGMGLPNWLRLLAMRPSIDVDQLPRFAGLSATSLINSLLNTAESLFWSRRVRRVDLPPAPIFILGHWRSGTTLLHNLLAMDDQFAWVNMYEAMFPGHFLLTEFFLPKWLSRWLPEQRPMDRMRIAWDLPQEDEPALLVLTLLSPYLQTAFPNQPDKWRRLSNLQSGFTPLERDTWRTAFVMLLKKVALRQPGKRLLLKSPTHGARIPMLIKLFPDAVFVHLVRNPYEVFTSTLRMRRAMQQLNGFSRREDSQLEEEVLQDYMTMYQAYQMQKALIPGNQLVEMRYEDLVDDPQAAMTTIYERFRLPGLAEIQFRLDNWLVEHRQYKTSSVPVSEEQRQSIAEEWAPAFRRYGYPL